MRKTLICLVLIFFWLASAVAAETTPTLHVGMTPALLHDQHRLLADWRSYMELELGRKVKFVMRDSYSETMICCAWKTRFRLICDYPYLAP